MTRLRLAQVATTVAIVGAGAPLVLVALIVGGGAAWPALAGITTGLALTWRSP